MFEREIYCTIFVEEETWYIYSEGCAFPMNNYSLIDC